MYLKVHKNENFFGFDFEFCAISLIVMLVLKLSGAKKISRKAKHFLYLKSYMTLLYLLILDFPKFDPLTVTGVALCVNLRPKCNTLVSD
jgi:hypothetical protein